MFVIEAAIAKAANEIGVNPRQIQEANLLDENDTFSYGQIAQKVEAKNTWNSAKSLFNIEALEQEVEDFNKRNSSFKKGIALMPITFGISFTNTPTLQFLCQKKPSTLECWVLTQVVLNWVWSPNF